MKTLSHRQQRTVAEPAEVEGIGFLTGKMVQLRFRPAPPNTGIVFVRSDLGPQARVAARVENVSGTHRRTTLGSGPLTITLVEHVLSALAGLHIDNCFIDLDAPEPPGLDGSAQGFVDALRSAGVAVQPERKLIWGVETSIVVQQDDATLCLHPPQNLELRASYLLDYGNFSPIDRQTFTSEITVASYAADIAGCRTFLLEQEAVEMRRQGYGARTSFTDLLVFGPHGPIDNRLRFANEPARHKVLDLIGDLALLGEPICGHVVAYRSGHPLNVELVRQLRQRLHQALPGRRCAA